MKILIYLEAQGNNLKRSSYETITAANSLNAETVGVIVNATSEQINSVGEYGLSKVINIKSDVLNNYSSVATSKAITEVANNQSIDTILLSANSTGKELAPRISVLFNAGYISDVTAIENNGELITKPVYAGKAIIKAKVTTPKAVYSLRPNVFTATKTDATTVTSEDFTTNISAGDSTVVVKSVKQAGGKLDVAEAEIIVAGGRGVKEPENFNVIENLADQLGAAVGASRAVVDAGWRPHGEQIGQTGKTVSPNLYIACAISGAVQHLAGMSSSKFIFAINKDKDAPIFKVADYGIVGDIFDVLPKLQEKIKSI